MNIIRISNQEELRDVKFGQCLYLSVPFCYEQNQWAEWTLGVYKTYCFDFSQVMVDKYFTLYNASKKTKTQKLERFVIVAQWLKGLLNGSKAT